MPAVTAEAETSKRPPIHDMSLAQINKIFSDFNDIYETSYKRFARRKGWDDMTILSMSLKDYVKHDMDSSAGDYTYPYFMRHFLGEGIVQSYYTIPTLQKIKETRAGSQQEPGHPAATGATGGARPDSPPERAAVDTTDGPALALSKVDSVQLSPDGPTPSGPEQAAALKPLHSARVGAALSTFHTLIRNAGKDWGLHFDKAALVDPQIVTNPAELARRKEFVAILDWMERMDDSPKGDAPDKRPPMPACLEGMDSKQIADEAIRRFAELPDIPLKMKQKSDGRLTEVKRSIPNERIQVKRTEYYDADSVTTSYEVPAAAVIWGIRPGGKSILGRGEGTPMRLFLETAVGVANEAGRKMVAIQDLVAKHAPEFALDYKRDAIVRGIEEQKYWLKTAAAVERIQGRSDKGYAQVLEMIGEDPGHINFYSASKTAVLLYVLADRMQQIKAETEPLSVSRPNRFRDDGVEPPNAAAVETMRRMNKTSAHNLSFDDTMRLIKELATELAEVGIETEKQLDAAKLADRGQQHRPGFYAGEVKRVFIDQRPAVEVVLRKHPEYEKAVDALHEYITALKQPANLNPDFMECADAAVRFCHKHVKHAQKAEDRHIPGQTALQ